jgi:peptide deformylase
MRQIIQVPSPVLYEISNPVNTIDGYIREVASEMLAVMTGKKGSYAIGLAAVQLGELVRVIAILENIYSPDFLEPVVIINPQVVKTSGKVVDSQEACLSIRHGTQFFTVKRDKFIRVVGLNLNGGHVSYKERGLLSFVLQHEIDHLDGKLISDRK